MKFQVPQFIEIEDKIFFSLSFKEFIYLAGGLGISYTIYHFVTPAFIGIPLALPVLAFFVALTFYKPNNRPFLDEVQAAVLFFTKNKLYIWKKENKPVPTKEIDMSYDPTAIISIPTTRRSSLKDIKGSLASKKYDGEEKSLNDLLNIKV